MPYVLRCAYIEWKNIYNCYIFFNWSLCCELVVILIPYVVNFLTFSNSLYFEVYFIWYDYCYSSFLLISICMEYLFLHSHLQFICVPRSEVVYVSSIYKGLVFVYIEPVYVFWLVAFNPFIFNVIIDRYVSVTFFLILLCLILWVFFLCFLPREVPLALAVKLVWWCWILLAFSCL